MVSPSTRRLATLALVALVVTSGCSALTDLDPRSADSGETALASFETTGPVCGDARNSSGSSLYRDVPGGRALSVNSTIPVRSNATRLTAELDEVGTHRYVLDIEREGGSGIPDCYLETRYNATVEFPAGLGNSHTLLVTYEDVLVAAYYADGNSGGSASGLASTTRYAPWARNVSEANGGLGDRP